jgi:hypothetical protein
MTLDKIATKIQKSRIGDYAILFPTKHDETPGAELPEWGNTGETASGDSSS